MAAILPADWYPDPADTTLHRWWDGTEWTVRLRPAVPLRPTAPSDGRGRKTSLALAEPESTPSFGPPGNPPAARIKPVVVDRRAVLPNPASTAAVVLGLVALVAFGGLSILDLSLTLGGIPALIALIVSCVAIDRARHTGSGNMRSLLGLLLALPLTGFAIWSFALAMIQLAELAL